MSNGDPDINQFPTQKDNPSHNSSSGERIKIPDNLEFQQDFLLRWDGSRALSIPRKKLAAHLYFKNMLTQIESAFAPPKSEDFVIKDSTGIVVRQAILPGESKVAFHLSDAGQVLDVKLMSSQGQEFVDRACMDSICGQNFGPVPKEAKSDSMIFGIKFIFPAMVKTGKE